MIGGSGQLMNAGISFGGSAQGAEAREDANSVVCEAKRPASGEQCRANRAG
jgi:hypothetical protein